ncbi:MAG: Hemolysins containing domain [Oscillospiraceae bacterium]|jgi:CBS domain containing-hemolysin-like protein|nr:Hemolysins containing domain [Oscillospiraceae bacterium]
MLFNFLLIVVLLLLSGFFSASETAFASVNRIRLKNYAAKGDKRAAKALEISENYDRTITAILVGNNIVNIASASLGTIVFTELFGDGGVGIATAAMTVLVLVFGEILPKSIAKENAEGVALSFAGILNLAIMLLTPLTWIFSKIKLFASKLVFSGEERPSVTEDELKYIIDEIEDEGVLEEQESDLVRNALEFDEILVGEVLVPRVNVVAVEKNQPVSEIEELFLNEMYSRMPVYEKSIDKIIGIINEKDFFKMRAGGGNSIEGIISKTLYFSELRPISEVLREMQKKKIHLAVVLDQYGGTQGIVTMEDIIEELVGEIYDENDEITPMLKKVSDNVYEVSAELSIYDMLEELELPEDIIESSSTSMGGWAMELFGRIPEEGDVITDGIFKVTVLKTDEQRILLLRVEVEANKEIE